MLFYSDIELVVRKSKDFEARLEQEFGAIGTGLGAKITKVRGKLPADTIKQLSQVRAIRNDIVHKKDVNRLKNRREFMQLCNDIESSLNKIAIRQRIQGNMGCFLILSGIVVLIIYSLLMNPS